MLYPSRNAKFSNCLVRRWRLAVFMRSLPARNFFTASHASFTFVFAASPDFIYNGTPRRMTASAR